MRVERRTEDYGKGDMAGASVLSFPELPRFFHYTLPPTSAQLAYMAEATGNRPLRNSLRIGSWRGRKKNERETKEFGKGSNSLILVMMMAFY